MTYQSRWVSVNERLPTPGLWVYCYLSDGSRCLSTISPHGKWLKTRAGVTHWMYPEDPEGNKDGA